MSKEGGGEGAGVDKRKMKKKIVQQRSCMFYSYGNGWEFCSNRFCSIEFGFM